MSRRKQGLVPKKTDGGEETEEIRNGEGLEQGGDSLLVVINLMLGVKFSVIP